MGGRFAVHSPGMVWVNNSWPGEGGGMNQQFMVCDYGSVVYGLWEYSQQFMVQEGEGGVQILGVLTLAFPFVEKNRHD